MTWKAFDDTDSTSEEDHHHHHHGDHHPSGAAAEEAAPSQPFENHGVSCCTRLGAEINPCQPHFRVADKATGRVVDIPESFSPPITPWTLGYKTWATLVVVAVLVYGWWNAPDPYFYLVLPEHWAVLLSTLYHLCSLWNTLWASRTPQPEVTASCRMRITWVLAQAGAHSQGMSVVLVWYRFYETDQEWGDYFHLVTDGGMLALLVWIDALWVNRIPFRWTHWCCYVLPLEALWVGWSAVHSLWFQEEIGNPYDSQDDDIYPFLRWDDDWTEASIYAAVALLGVGPFIFGMFWWVSIYLLPCFTCNWKDKRKYLDSFRDHPDPRPTVNDVEEGSIFGTSRWARAW